MQLTKSKELSSKQNYCCSETRTDINQFPSTILPTIPAQRRATISSMNRDLITYILQQQYDRPTIMEHPQEQHVTPPNNTAEPYIDRKLPHIKT